MKIQIILSILVLINGKLLIYDGSDELKRQYKEGISYSMAEFGHYQHNKQMIGQIIKGNPINGCNVQNISEHKVDSHIKSPFILMRRGDCTFVTKAKFGQLYGAKLVIIIDNLDEQIETVNMADDGHGFYNLDIATILISKWDGERLLKYLEKDILTLSILFETHQQAQTSYTFFLSTSNRQSFRLVRDFYPYYQQLKGQLKFNVIYSHWTDLNSRQSNFTSVNPSYCLSRGRYCTQNVHNNYGKELVIEDLRQICIFMNDNTQWFQYVDQFDKECVDYLDLKQCGDLVQQQLNINKEQINSCIRTSFMNNNNNRINYEEDDNIILADHKKQYNKQGVYYTPSVYINGFEFKGRLNATDIFESICESTPYHIEQCKLYQDNKYVEQNAKQYYGIIAFIIPLLIIFLILMIIFYRRMVKREMSMEINSQVNQMLSQYMAFKGNNEADNKNKL